MAKPRVKTITEPWFSEQELNNVVTRNERYTARNNFAIKEKKA